MRCLLPGAPHPRATELLAQVERGARAPGRGKLRRLARRRGRELGWRSRESHQKRSPQPGSALALSQERGRRAAPARPRLLQRGGARWLSLAAPSARGGQGRLCCAVVVQALDYKTRSLAEAGSGRGRASLARRPESPAPPGQAPHSQRPIVALLSYAFHLLLQILYLPQVPDMSRARSHLDKSDEMVLAGNVLNGTDVHNLIKLMSDPSSASDAVVTFNGQEIQITKLFHGGEDWSFTTEDLSDNNSRSCARCEDELALSFLISVTSLQVSVPFR